MPPFSFDFLLPPHPLQPLTLPSSSLSLFFLPTLLLYLISPPFCLDLMDALSCSPRLSSASKTYKSRLLSPSDMFMRFEEIDGDEDWREEFSCPFCTEYFDIVGLCCHIDEEHPLEAKNGVCPVCARRAGLDMVAHITLQHGNIFKMQRKRRLHKTGSHSTLSLIKKELREGKLQALLGSSYLFPSSNTAPDPMLSSFILPMADASQPQISELSSSKKIPSEHAIERSTSSLKDKEETAKRGEFVQGLLLSTILDENL